MTLSRDMVLAMSSPVVFKAVIAENQYSHEQIPPVGSTVEVRSGASTIGSARIISVIGRRGDISVTIILTIDLSPDSREWGNSLFLYAARGPRHLFYCYNLGQSLQKQSTLRHQLLESRLAEFLS